MAGQVERSEMIDVVELRYLLAADFGAVAAAAPAAQHDPLNRPALVRPRVNAVSSPSR
jgi:hypothetical protein